jgi:hypothetical protein
MKWNQDNSEMRWILYQKKSRTKSKPESSSSRDHKNDKKEQDSEKCFMTCSRPWRIDPHRNSSTLKNRRRGSIEPNEVRSKQITNLQISERSWTRTQVISPFAHSSLSWKTNHPAEQVKRNQEFKAVRRRYRRQVCKLWRFQHKKRRQIRPELLLTDSARSYKP